MNKEQHEYVQGELALGVTPEKIKSNLLGAGYTDEQVAELFDFAQSKQPEVPQPSELSSGQAEVKKSVLPRIIFYTCFLLLVFGMLGFILNSVNRASDQTSDASDKLSLSSFRAQAEVYNLANSESYAGLCDSVFVTEFARTNETLFCVDSFDTYQMSVQLGGGDYSCIDSLGASKTVDYRPLGYSCGSQIPAENDSRSSTGPEQTLERADEQNIQILKNIVGDVTQYYIENDFSYSAFCGSPEALLELPSITGADCHAKDDVYRISIRLSNSQYYCIDQTGFSGQVEKRPFNSYCGSGAVPEDTDFELIEDSSAADTFQDFGFMIPHAMFYYYGNYDSYVGLCSSADVQSVLNNIAGSECLDSDDMYRMTASFSGDSYYCIDGTGFSDEITTKPDGLQCNPADKPTNRFLLQAEEMMLADAAKVMRQHYKNNQESYEGACDFLLERMPNSGLDISCVSEADRYRVSALLSDGMYQCVAESASTPDVSVYSPEINVSLVEAPEGFNCE